MLTVAGLAGRRSGPARAEDPCARPAVARLSLLASATVALLFALAFPTAPLNASPARTVAVDFNRDGASDELHLNGAGAFTLRFSAAARPVQLHKNIVSFVAADIDHDGDRDIIALSAKGNLHVWKNDGHGRFGHTRISAHRRHHTLDTEHAGLQRDAASDDALETPVRLEAVLVARASLSHDLAVVGGVHAPRPAHTLSACLALLPSRAPPAPRLTA